MTKIVNFTFFYYCLKTCDLYITASIAAANCKPVQHVTFENSSCVQYTEYSILISDLVVAGLFVHSLSDMILLDLANHFFYTNGVFASIHISSNKCGY